MASDPRAQLVHAVLETAPDHTTDLTYRLLEPDVVAITSRAGEVVFERSVDGWQHLFHQVSVTGSNPVAVSDAAAFAGWDTQIGDPYAASSANSFPIAFESVAQLFDGEHAPDVVVQHHPAHRYGGNIGQHGSLGIVQARAPFIVAGAGVDTTQSLGTVRTVDVAPTIATLLGLGVRSDSVGPAGLVRPDGRLARQDGDPVPVVLDGGARRVLVILLDGLNPATLDHAIQLGLAPNLAALAERGAVAPDGMFAYAPTATLANHTALTTGAAPGHSGVIHHTWWNRATGETPDLLSLDQMPFAMNYVAAGVESIFEAVRRNRPDAVTVAGFEICDKGVEFSSFEPMRRGAMPDFPPADTLTTATQQWVAADAAYALMSSVDELATSEAVRWWTPGQLRELPTLCWYSLSLTDEAGHVGGPYSEMTLAAVADCDARIGRVLAQVDAAGCTDETAVLVVADHGMAQSSPDAVGDWTDALARTGVDHVDVDGWLYLR